MNENVIRIQGARQHNLKNINLEIPRNTLAFLIARNAEEKLNAIATTIVFV